MKRNRRKRCPCGGELLWETVAGMVRVYRMVGRRRVYSVRCKDCRMTMEITK